MTRSAAPGSRGLPRRAAGFTLVELIAVMVIVGILAAVAAPRFFATDVFAESGYAAELRAGLRHAQALALSSGCATRVVVDASGFRLQRWRGGADCNDRSGAVATLGQPGGGTYDTRAPRGVSATAVDLHFDSFGRPRAADGTRMAAPVTLVVGAQRITVQAETGLVQ